MKIKTEDFGLHITALLDLLKQLVEMESPSTEKQALDGIGSFVAERMRALDADVTRFPQEGNGDHWLGSWGDGPGGLLLLAHLDTVYPIGTLATIPWRQDPGYVYGPGCLDMKVSVAMALIVIDRLISMGLMRQDRVALLCTSDEEIGSPSSRHLIEQEARKHDLVLCLEPALPDGSLKTWRKGILNFEVVAQGKAAHAGSDINAGTNAIVEIVHQVPKILELVDRSEDTTINIGVIEGGSRSNVVPETCTIQVDARAKMRSEGERVLKAMRGLRPVLDGSKLTIEGGWNRPPMERDALMQTTFHRAQEITSNLGIRLSEGGTGGGSDANFVAGIGIPVLDGLGAIGAGAHSSDEKVALKSLPLRCALLAALIVGW